MKMMKTEMEFVTFDAQDVITTSVGLVTASFTVDSGLFAGPTGAYGLTYDPASVTWTWNPSEGSQTKRNQSLGLEGLDIENGVTYVLTQDQSYADGNVSKNKNTGADLWIYGATELADGQKTTSVLTSLADIFQWLTDYGLKLQ